LCKSYASLHEISTSCMGLYLDNHLPHYIFVDSLATAQPQVEKVLEETDKSDVKTRCIRVEICNFGSQNTVPTKDVPWGNWKTTVPRKKAKAYETLS